ELRGAFPLGKAVGLVAQRRRVRRGIDIVARFLLHRDLYAVLDARRAREGKRLGSAQHLLQDRIFGLKEDLGVIVAARSQSARLAVAILDETTGLERRKRKGLSFQADAAGFDRRHRPDVFARKLGDLARRADRSSLDIVGVGREALDRADLE